MRIEYPAKPLVVADLNWLQRRARGSDYLSNRAAYLFSDVTFVEIATRKEKGRILGDAAKVLRIIRANADRVFVGRYWHELSQMEARGRPVPREAVIRPDITQLAREMSQDDIEAAVGAMSGMSEQVAQHERHRSAFVDMCTRWTNWIRDTNPDGVKATANDPAKQLEWIRRPDQVVALAVEQSTRFDTPEGRAALAVFPDVLALGRFARIILWYALMHCIGKTSKFENNWDDAHYAHLASYTGLIATDDGRLRSLISAVFPSVQVWDALDR